MRRNAAMPSIALLCLAVLITAASASASTVSPMTVQTLSDHAGQVIVGRVASIRSYWADNPRRIESEIHLETVEYFKGRLADSTGSFTLIVPGGKVGEMQMQIADAPTFAVGEKWVLFLLPTYKTFPVVGLHQGAFRVEADAAGVERIYLPEHDAVIGIAPDGLLKSNKNDAHQPMTRMVGANDVQVRPVQNQTDSAQPAISLQDFRRQLSPILDASRNHPLTEPAGKRVPVAYTPSPFRTAAQGNPPATRTNGSGLRGNSAPEATNQPKREQPKDGPTEGRP